MKKNSTEPTQIRSAEIEDFSAPGDEGLGAEIPDAVGQGLASALFAVRNVSLNEEAEHTGLSIAIAQALTITGVDPHQWECALVKKAGLSRTSPPSEEHANAQLLEAVQTLCSTIEHPQEQRASVANAIEKAREAQKTTTVRETENALEATARCLVALQDGRSPPRRDLVTAVQAGMRVPNAQIGMVGAGLGRITGIVQNSGKLKEEALNATLACLEAIKAISEETEPDNAKLAAAVRWAINNHIVHAEDVDCPIYRRVAGMEFAGLATQRAHMNSRRPEAKRLPVRRTLTADESARIVSWLGAPEPRSQNITGPGGVSLHCDAKQSISEVARAIEAAERNALEEATITGPRKSTQDVQKRTARRGTGAGEDLYTRRARLQRLRHRLEDASIVADEGDNELAWKIALASAHRLASATRYRVV